jgi:thiazole/oxazole-forming peptide maturase SagD family component
MRLSVTSIGAGLPIATQRLVRRMVSPMCGIDQMVVTFLRGRYEPRFIVAAGQLSGVHVLLGQGHPGSYHIGGYGITPHEALIRALAESVERYAQFIADATNRHERRFATYAEMIEDHQRLIDSRSLEFFSDEQHRAQEFPFQRFSSQARMTWVRTVSMVDHTALWVPSQLVFVGYHPRRADGEPWLIPAVTTGSAAHTVRAYCLRNALLELVQVDAAIGHWYSDGVAPEIRLDERTQILSRIIERNVPKRWPPPRFHWLASPDLGCMTVACVLQRPSPSLPALAVGLGIDTRLGSAMYKALLEAVGVMQLAKVNMLNADIEKRGDDFVDPEQILDLDTNVGYYALPENAALINHKFTRTEVVESSQLPPDSDLEAHDEVESLISGFARTGKQLLELDLTTEDIRELGFITLRVWSPDLLSIPLPSTPPMNHRRFEAYGGATHRHPHPYP